MTCSYDELKAVAKRVAAQDWSVVYAGDSRVEMSMAEFRSLKALADAYAAELSDEPITPFALRMDGWEPRSHLDGVWRGGLCVWQSRVGGNWFVADDVTLTLLHMPDVLRLATIGLAVVTQAAKERDRESTDGALPSPRRV